MFESLAVELRGKHARHDNRHQGETWFHLQQLFLVLIESLSEAGGSSSSDLVEVDAVGIHGFQQVHDVPHRIVEHSLGLAVQLC